MSRFQNILLVLILLLGVGLRSVEVLNRNFLFGYDQGRDYLAVKDIVDNRNPTLIGPEVGAGYAGLSGIFHGPYYYYSLVLPYLVLAGDPYGGLLLMFLFGTASLFLCYFFIREIFGVKEALAGTFLVALCPALTAQSRFIWNSHPTTFFVLLALWFTARIPKNPFRYFFLAAFTAGLIYGFELAISVPLLLAQFVYVLMSTETRKLKVLLGGVLGVLIAHLPFFLFEIRHGFMALKGIFSVFAKPALDGGKTVNIGVVFREHLGDFWSNFQNTFSLPWWAGIVLLATMTYSAFIIKKQPPILRFLLLLAPVSFFIFLLINNTVWDYYLIHLHLAYIILFSYYLINTQKIPGAILAIMFLVIMTGMVREMKRAVYDYSDYGGVAKIAGKIDALNYIYEDAQNKPFNVLVFTPPVHDYAYRYLLAWYGQKKYGFTPSYQKQGLFYLWIEPEGSGIWHKGWLETVVKDGEILKEEVLPNGFIIQKRYAEI